MRLLFVILVAFFYTAKATEPIPGLYMAVTETEYAINLSLQPNGKAILTLKLYAVEEHEHDSEQTFNGDWKINGTKISINLGTAGIVNYEIQQCLPFEEFGHEGCGFGLKAIKTNTEDSYSLVRYNLWKEDVLPQ